MKTVINIALPRGFLGGRPAIATTRTTDDQKRDADGKFGLGDGSSSGGSKKAPEKKSDKKSEADFSKMGKNSQTKAGKAVHEHMSGTDLKHFSHGAGENGYFLKGGSSKTTHKDLHEKLKEAGLSYGGKSSFGDWETHNYRGRGEGYSEESVGVRVRKDNGKVDHVSHKVVGSHY